MLSSGIIMNIVHDDALESKKFLLFTPGMSIMT